MTTTHPTEMPASARQPRPAPPTSTEERSRSLLLAAHAGCDRRTALRALREGPQGIRTLSVREAVTRAMGELGFAVGEAR